MKTTAEAKVVFAMAFLAVALAAGRANGDASAFEKASRAGKGVLVLQTGSDWCVSGEQLRKVFEGAEFRRAVGSKYVLATYDEMDTPTEAVKTANSAVKDILVRTKRFPAITCYAGGKKLRFFAQIENVPGDVTAEKLAKVVARYADRKDRAEALFKKAASTKGNKAADLYGEGFDLLFPMVGPFHRKELMDGKCAWSKEWETLKDLDSGDTLGWVKHFEMDDAETVKMVETVTAQRKAGTTSLVDTIRRIPQDHFSVNQRQCVKIMEYAAATDGTEAPLKPACKAALKAAFEMGRDTLWGQFAMGRLIMDGEKIESKGLKKAEVRPRPRPGDGGARQSFELARAESAVHGIKPGAKLTEQQKLAIARHAVLRLIGQRGWNDLVARPGSGRFLKAFMNDRTWLEDFAWSGTFPSSGTDANSTDGAAAGDGAAAALALESLIFQDDGRWVPFADGAFADNEGRRFMTALAIVYPEKDEAWLADVLDAYRATAKAGRLHKSAYSQPVWQWRFAVHQGHRTAGADNMAAQQRHIDKFVNLPMREYGGTCWMICYRLANCFGDSVHGPLYYKPWAVAGEWPKRKYSQLVGGVCGELSKFGSATANAHGLPSTTVGQPGHCAYSRRLLDGRWEVNYTVTGHSQMHMCFWNAHPWQYSVAIEKTFMGEREKRLDADRFVELALVAEKGRAKPSDIEAYYRAACASWRTHYGAWKAYGDWVSRTDASIKTMRTWVRGCARGMKTGRQPLWDLLTPYYARLFKEKGKKALAEDLVAFAPLLRQSDESIVEEADLKETLAEWAKPLDKDAELLSAVLKAMLLAQYGTKDYFSQVLGWGSDTMIGEDGLASFFKVLDEVVAEKSAGGSKAKLDFAPLILSASKAGNLAAFRQLAQLQDKLEPVPRSNKSYPTSDFGGTLLSSDGMLMTSSTCNWDHPSRYARCIDATPLGENGFHTDKEKSPWAVVVLPGPSEIRAVKVENNAGGSNRSRQVPIEIQLSEDGEVWETVLRDGETRETYVADIHTSPRRASQVRVRRLPEDREDFFHLGKILVYGKKLY